MGDAIDVDIAEFGALRDEINNRTNLAYTLIGLQLATLGAGLAVIDKVPEVVIGLAAASSFLWLSWLDHVGQIYKIAAYVSLRLSPRLRRQFDGVLGWELFLRELDAGGSQATQALFPGRDDPGLKLAPTVSVNWYTGLLFGASPPLLLGGYLASRLLTPERGDVPQLIALAVSTIVWVLALNRYRGYQATVRTINQAILSAAEEEHSTGQAAVPSHARQSP